jgi:hypothetical protein
MFLMSPMRATYASHLVLFNLIKYCMYMILAKEEEVLQGMNCRLIESGRRCGMEMNVKKKN